MSILDRISKRLDLNNDSDNYQYYNDTGRERGLRHMQARLNARGGTDQWTRMRQDKLWSLEKALLSSYQSAIVQKYDVQVQTVLKNLETMILKCQNHQDFDQTDEETLTLLLKYYTISTDDRTSTQFRNELFAIREHLAAAPPKFRCLINHDKLKVDYEDKIISIPFREPPIGSDDPIDTGFSNGTIFKWIHGNKEQWTPDSYWIVYLQYSEETAYFRAEIRKADEQIQIVVDGETYYYRGWMTGPNETNALWNVKKDIAWNDLNYTKLLYITKDNNTLAFFKRFQRIMINGKPWQVQAYNENYGVNSSLHDSGIIRVALKETYVDTDQFVDETLTEMEEAEAAEAQADAANTDACIDGPTTVKPFDIITYVAKNYDEVMEWSLSTSTLAKIKKVSEDGKSIIVEILTGYSNANGFDINYGDETVHVTIGSL